MASLKETFAKGITTLNVKTNNFMEENKCKTYISTLEEEIRKLKQSLGEIVYENRENIMAEEAKMKEIAEQITAKYDEIKVQEDKIKALAEAEQQILGTSAANETAQTNADVIYCSECGMQNQANYKFCCKCGKQLSE